MSAILNIYDASSMLYAGTLSKYQEDYLGGNHLKGLPVGGVRYVLSHALRHLYDREDVVIVFDSPTDKKSLFPDYKSTRVPNPAIIVQQMMLYDMCTRMKITTVKKDTYEADDLVYAYLNKYASDYAYVNIYSGDTDLAANITRSGVTLVGTASIYPTINSSNFSEVLNKSVRVPFNEILPYYYFFGKPSNAVPALAGSKKPADCFNSFTAFCEAEGIPEGARSGISVMCRWLLNAFDSGELAGDDMYVKRLGYVYPKLCEDENVLVKSGTAQSLAKDQVLFFVRMLKLHWILRLAAPEESLGDLTSQMYDYILRYKQHYETGCMAVDVDTTPDLSFFANKTEAFSMDDGGLF